MAIEKEYKWDRFWCPSNKSYMLNHRGFLLDPESPIAKYYDSFALKFDEIPNSPCLVLLGEPGIGKTKVLDDIYNLAKSKEGARVIRIDLRSYNTADGLVFDLNNNPEIQDWIKNNYHLSLFFDSLDECLLNARTVASSLIDRVIKNWPHQRLGLRFVCRTIDWPDLLENELRSLYGLDEVPKYELLPLREKDIAEAAIDEDIDPDKFLESVLSTEVTAFAIRPVTLKFLLSCYKKDGHLPRQKSEIYWQGCLQLCEENNKSRIASRQTGTLTPIQRLIIASRIAAIVLLSKKSSILIGGDSGTISPSDVSIQALSGFTESYKNIVVAVNENAIKETLGTGLFSSRGNNQIGFAHQTYAEFLAAYYLNTSKIPYHKVSELILHSGGKVIPQLQEVAIWLATFSHYFFERILPNQPDLILRMDKAAITGEDKKILVSRLLDAYETKELVDVHDVTRYLDHVDHPDLGDQLMPILKDKNKAEDTRRLAILIARECKVIKAIDLLISIALDSDENYRIRKYASHAILDIGSNEEKAKLLPLALGNVGDDIQDELKGIGLKAVWPDHISIDALLELITPMKDENLIGEYYAFLDYDFAASLQPESLTKVLNWITDEMPILGSEIVADNLIVGVMHKGWENIENPEIGLAFARLVEKRLRNYEDARSFSKDKSYLSEIKDHPEKRRLLIKLLLELINKPQDVFNLLSVNSTIAIYEDVDWIIEELILEVIPGKRLVWAQLLFYLINRTNFDDVIKAYSIYETYPDVSEIFSPMFAPVILDSELARSSREYGKLMKERDVRQEPESVVPVDYQAQLLDYVDNFDAGDSNAWWKLNLVILTGEPNRDANEFDADLTLFFLWKQASDELQDRLLTIAGKYLDTHPAGEIYTEDKRLWRPALSAFRAFYLVATKNPLQLHDISSAIWNKWASVILSYPDAGEKYNIETHQKLLSELYRNRDNKFFELLDIAIKNENSSNLDHILKLLEPVESIELQNFLILVLDAKELTAYAFEELLRFLLVRNNDVAKEFAQNIICSDESQDDAYKEKRLAVARALILHSNDAGWPVIKQKINKDIEFGELLFQSLAHFWDSLAVVMTGKLSEFEIGDLFIWLEEHFPAKNDPVVKGFHSVTDRESVGQFRDSLIQVLSKKGSEQACIILTQLIEKFPDKEEWLLYYLRVSEMNFRQNTWEPVMPYQILEIIHNAKEIDVRQIRKMKASTILLVTIEVVVGIFMLTLPNLIDYQNNSVWAYLKNHQVLTTLLLVLSVGITIILPQLKKSE